MMRPAGLNRLLDKVITEIIEGAAISWWFRVREKAKCTVFTQGCTFSPVVVGILHRPLTCLADLKLSNERKNDHRIIQ